MGMRQRKCPGCNKNKRHDSDGIKRWTIREDGKAICPNCSPLSESTPKTDVRWSKEDR